VSVLVPYCTTDIGKSTLTVPLTTVYKPAMKLQHLWLYANTPM